MEKMQRKEREFKWRREAILQKAEAIFASKGYYSATMAEIAEASGFAIGTLYQFFSSKEELYKTVITEKIQLSQSRIGSVLDKGKTSGEKIELLIKNHLSFVEDNIGFFSILIRWEGIFEAEGKRTLFEQLLSYYDDYLDLIAGIVKEGMDRGELKGGDARACALSLLGIIDAFAFNWLRNPQRGGLISMAGQIRDVYFHGVYKHEIR